MIDGKTFARYAADPAAFRNDLIVDVDGVARRFGDVQDDWQRADFALLDPAIKRAASRSQEPARMRGYFERGRGHSKTTDLGVTCCWMMGFASRPLRGYAFAADKDQAALLKDAMATLVRLNPWLGAILDVQKNLVVNIAAGHPGAGSKLDIFTSDVASSYGILPDFVIADELTHWEGDGSLWHSIISSAAKRRNCLLAVISNAGFVDSWQWAVREAARTSPDSWIFSRLDGPVASWMTEDRLNEQRKMLPAIAFARLWGNNWSTGGGDALTREDVEAAFREDLEPMKGSESDWLFIAGIDLGLTRDASAVVVLAVPNNGRGAGRIRLAHTKLWRPQPGRKVDLLEVERHIRELDDRFDLEFVAFDPWQMEHLAQRLETESVHRRRNQRRRLLTHPWMREIPPTATNLRAQAAIMIESFTDRRMMLYDEPNLRRDLLRLRVEEKSYGFRLVSPRDEHGHGDTASAFALALLIAHEQAGFRKKVLQVGISGRSTDRRKAMAAAWEARQAAYRAEMEKLGQGGFDDSHERLREILGGLRTF